MGLYINMKTSEATDALPYHWDGYYDIEPWKSFEDVTTKDLILIIGRLQKRVAKLEEDAHSGAEDVGG